MSKLLFSGGTIVTADGTYKADVLAEAGSGRFIERTFVSLKRAATA